MGSDVFRRLYENILSNHGLFSEEARILDIGAYDGKIADNLAATDATVIAVDLEFTRGSQSHKCEFLRGDGTELPIGEGAADAVISNMVFEHVRDEEAMVAEVARVLSDDGIFVSIFPNRAWPGNDHGYPPGLSWFPKSVAGPVANRYDRRCNRGEDWYQQTYHPVWSVSVRTTLEEYFENVDYRSAELLDVEFDHSDRRQLMLSKCSAPLELLFGNAVSRRLLEAVFPTTVYVSRGKKPQA